MDSPLIIGPYVMIPTPTDEYPAQTGLPDLAQTQDTPIPVTELLDPPDPVDMGYQETEFIEEIVLPEIEPVIETQMAETLNRLLDQQQIDG